MEMAKELLAAACGAQGGARYTWDGMTSYGMIERSATGEQLAAPPA